MASCKENSGLTRENKRLKGEKTLEESSNVEPKMNRLKRAKRTKMSEPLSSECKIIRPEITQHHCVHQKCSHMAMRPPTIHGAQCSLPKPGVLHMTVSQEQSAPEIKSESIDWGHREPLSGRGSHDDRRREESKSGNSTALNSYYKLAPTSQSHRTRFESPATSFKNPLPREEVLKQVDTQNSRFPVGRLFQTLLKPHGEIKSSRVTPEVGKRKQEVETHCDTHHCKRQRTGRDDSETVKTSEGCERSRSGGNRLRRKRPHVRNTAVGATQQEDDVGHEDDAGYHDEDVPWTEKCCPRSCDEVVGNSAAVRKLYCWLKEWRMRADVEERRKRREERRMKEESDGSWDCGDFQGDLLMEECDGKLCNTLLICGPTGTGKSAAVFACAEQLGFKVLEVNSSSLRSGRLVLSQLRESTQSHQVGAPQRSVSLTHSPVEASRKAPQESASSRRKPAAIPLTSSRKERDTRQTSVTLTRYFGKTGKFGNKHLELPQDTAVVVDDVTLDEPEFKKGGALEKNDKTAGISLILFEEVDIIFEEDVGFLAAVKSLMSTTKRPIILTANDRWVGETFDGRFEEIRFKTPAVESVVNYLQCMSERVQNVKAEPEHMHFLLQENNGDMRRSVLELEFWARSGGGDTHYHLHNRALTCKSFTELESSRCVEVLVENWRKGRSLLYSNLDFLLAPPTAEKSDRRSLDHNTLSTFQNKSNEDSSPSVSRKCSRVKGPKTKPSLPLRHRNRSAAEAGEIPTVNSLARFLDTMSFIDSYLCRQPFCKSRPLGAKMADGLLDEPREEEEVGAEMRTRGLERCYETMAVVEGLGFHTFRMEVRTTERGDQDVTGGYKYKTCKLREEKCSEVVRRVLRCKTFRFQGNRTAVLTDYLPCLRFICREQGAESQSDLRFSHYLRDIGLRLPKSILDLLASQLR